MLSKNQIKHIRQLKSSKHRNNFNEFIAEGPKVVGELLQSSYRVKQIFALPAWIERNNRFSDLCHPISTKELNQISLLKTPNAVLCIAEIPKQDIIQNREPNSLTLILDGINDPGNMGTIIRTADWFGINEIICSNDCVDIYNSKVIQASMGSISRVKINYSDLNEFLKRVPKEIKIYGAYLEGDSIYTSSLTKVSYLIIGSESHGISAKTGCFINQKLTIPRFSDVGSMGAESLNASIATAIFCSEFKRGK